MAQAPSALGDAPWATNASELPARKASLQVGPTPLPNRPIFEALRWIFQPGAQWPPLPTRVPLTNPRWPHLWDAQKQGVWRKA
jgi:hypothetical protein